MHQSLAEPLQHLLIFSGNSSCGGMETLRIGSPNSFGELHILTFSEICRFPSGGDLEDDNQPGVQGVWRGHGQLHRRLP